MKKIILSILFSLSFVFAANIGPVSQYGELMVGAPNGKGQIYGSCKGVVAGEEVQVKGMSLYWSLLDDALEFWNKDAVSTMVRDMNIQLIRASMATGNEDWSGPAKGYASDADKQKNYVNEVVQAAIDNDIYVIIDWHSHEANNQLDNAKRFFGEMAQKWGKYDNVIFEVFNEPTDQSWSVVKNYAEQVIQTIRQYSDNLVIVGNPQWSATPNSAINNAVNDKNVAYTFHYYAGTHKVGSEGSRVTKTINAGLAVFVSEWGTGTADGKGNATDYTSSNDNWQNYMNTNKLSWANWSASKINEGTAAFNSGSNRYSLSFSNSGNMVKGYLSSNPTIYQKCNTQQDQPIRIVRQNELSKQKVTKLYFDALGKPFKNRNNYYYKFEL